MSMKKLLCAFLSTAMLLSVGVVACAGNTSDSEPEITPYAVVYEETVYASNGHYVSTPFTCTEGAGNSLRYWFQNNGSSNCTVNLYKRGFFKDTLVSSMTVSPNDPGGKTGVIRNPHDSTFYFKLQSSTGGVVRGLLKANQLEL